MFKQRLSNPEVPEIATLSISSMSDYHVFDFPGKEQQREQVVDLLDQQGFIPDDLIEQEVDWFYNSLGIDDLFFSRESPQLIANIVHSLYASKLESFAKSNFVGVQPQHFNIKNKIITDSSHAIFMESNSASPEFLEKTDQTGGIDQQLEGGKATTKNTRITHHMNLMKRLTIYS